MKRRRRSISLSLILECNDADSCVVYFEPLGTEHVLRKGDLFRVQVDGDDVDEIEIMHSPNSLSVGIYTPVVRVTNRAGEELQL